MRLFDTRTGGMRPFLAGRTVRLYVCGITPYDASHLGHAFTYLAFDVLVRYLEHRGHQVRYVRNITDVDDDILRRARELGVDVAVLARQEVIRFDRELAAMGLRRPDVEPWVSETIDAIVVAVSGLVEAGAAYALDDGRVYFDTTAAGTRFGALSRLDRPTMLEQFAEKGGDPEAPGKRDALDFLLWQPSAPDEPSWPSPWGEGRPGWHIECSVMANEHLGNTIDIHGGGHDLVFPHHEAETLQAESLYGQAPFARFWLHTGMTAMDGEKMSKSLGNLIFLGDLLERYEPGAVRCYLLEHHYRSDWAYDDRGLEAAAGRFKSWQEAAGAAGEDEAAEAAFLLALDDDLDTPGALDVLDEAAAAGAGKTLRRLAAVLGLDLAPARL